MSFVSFMLKMMIKGGKKIENNLNNVIANPAEEQKKLLFSILSENKNTKIGEEFNFENITSIKEFQKRIPLTDYDFYAEKIEHMIKGEENILTAAKTVHFNTTSGTMGNPKRIPIIEKHVGIFSGYYAKYINYLVSQKVGDAWTNGKGLTLTEGKYTILPTGISCGSASSLSSVRMGKMIPFMKIDMMGTMYTSPIEARIPSPETPTRFLHALFALREKNITYASATFSSYLLELMRYIEDHHEMLIDIIETGNIPDTLIKSDKDRNQLKKKLKPSKQRAQELRTIFAQGFDEPIAKKIWPKLTWIMTVGGAGFSSYTKKLRERYIGFDVCFVFLGLSASEGMFSVPFECENTNAVFVPDSIFMEFVPVEDDKPIDYNGPIYTLDQVEVGKKYEIVATTVDGLLRYKMKDVVEIVGFHNNTPTMEFCNRSGFAISMYGEKTSEKALQFMAEKTCEELGFELYDYAVCPDDDETPGCYVLCLELRYCDKNKIDLEKIRATAQKYLSQANPSVGKKMDTGVIQPLKIKLLQEETFLLYRDMMTMKGRAAAQLKPVHVLNTPFLKKLFYTLSYSEKDISKK